MASSREKTCVSGRQEGAREEKKVAGESAFRVQPRRPLGLDGRLQHVCKDGQILQEEIKPASL